MCYLRVNRIRCQMETLTIYILKYHSITCFNYGALLDHGSIGIIVIYAVVKLLGNILINLLSGWSPPATLNHIGNRH